MGVLFRKVRRSFQTLRTPLAVAASLGAIAAAIYVVWTGSPDYWRRSLIFALVANAVLFGFSIYGVWRYAKYRLETGSELARMSDAKSLISSQATSMIDSAQMRDRAMLDCLKELETILGRDFEFCQYLRTDGIYSTADQLKAELDRYVVEVLTHIAKLFTAYTGNKCSACMKVFTKKSRKKEVINIEAKRAVRKLDQIYTFARDQTSTYERNQAVYGQNEIYSYKDNTAFYNIMHQISDWDGFYTRNDLKNCPHSEYRNSNKNWSKLYDAVCVSSLRVPSTPHNEQSLGFLCIDNIGGNFDNLHCRLLLECCASILYYSTRMTFNIYYIKKGETT